MSDQQPEPEEDLSLGFSLLKQLSAFTLVEKIGDGVWQSVGPTAGNSGPGVGSFIPDDGEEKSCGKDWS